MGDDFKFTAGQKNKIYNEQLKPLKLRISQILLYDTKVAIQLLQEYNELIENTPDNELMDKITELEFRITEYEKGQGKEKSFEDKSQTIISQIEELNTMSENLSLDDFEQEVSKLIENYKDKLGDYNFGDRDEIEDKIYELKAKLVMREVNELYPDNIDISKEDEIGLMMYLNKELNRMQQNKNPKVKSYIERVKYNLMSGPEALHNSETWKLLSYAQKEKFETETIITNKPLSQNTALSVIKKTRPQFNLMQKIVSTFSSKFFSKDPKLPLSAKDLGKISLDWLAKYIPIDMVKDIENQRLEKENRDTENKYTPDSKSVIYWIMEKLEDPNKIEGYYWSFGYNKFFKFDKKLNYANKFLFNIDDFGNMLFTRLEYVYKQCVKIDPKMKLPQCLAYAELVDAIMKTSFGYCFCDCLEEYCSDNNKAELTYEKDGESLKYFCPSYAKYDKDRYKDLYKGILESFEMIQQECRETKDAFWEEENQKREAFYKAQKSEKTAETKEQQFRNRIQSQSEAGKITVKKSEETGKQMKQEQTEKGDKDDLTH